MTAETPSGTADRPRSHEPRREFATTQAETTPTTIEITAAPTATRSDVATASSGEIGGAALAHVSEVDEAPEREPGRCAHRSPHQAHRGCEQGDREERGDHRDEETLSPSARPPTAASIDATTCWRTRVRVSVTEVAHSNPETIASCTSVNAATGRFNSCEVCRKISTSIVAVPAPRAAGPRRTT